jgi:threonine dehydrogenase-like Zn-dependent dehydrogenase
LVQSTGIVVLKSTYAGEHPVQLAPLVINEVKVVGSRCGPFSKALYDLLKDRVDPRDLITEIVPFSEWDRAFEIAKNPESVKVLLQFES